MTKFARLGPYNMAMVARKQAKTGDGSKQESDDSGSDSDDEHDEHQGPRPKPRHSFETQADRGRPMPPIGTACGLDTVGVLKPSRSGSARRAGEKRALDEEDGYVDESKKAARKRDGGRSFPVGDQRSCAQDGLINGAKQLGLKIVKKEVYDAALPAKGDTKVEAIVNYASSIGIQMLNVKTPGTLDVPMFQIKGGPKFALLNQEGVFFVELLIALEGNPSDKHAVVFNSAYTCTDFPQCRGVIIDNEAMTPPKHIEPKERENVADARKMFDSLFPGADRVSVVGAWLMRPVQPVPTTPRRE